MDPTMLKMAVGGFIHDIGKLVNKNILQVSQDYLDSHSNVYLPVWNGRYSHTHAVYTCAFIEKFSDLLPKEFNQPGWGDGDSMISLAAGHHKPETPMQWIITDADRISSGMDRVNYDNHNAGVRPRDYQKTRLVSIFERLSKEVTDTSKGSESHEYCYPLKVQGPESLFPIKKTDCPAGDFAESEYDSLFTQFIEGTGRLKHKNESIELWFEHFESLVMLCCGAVPSARAGKVVPDISLYDHLKTTSAIAAALYGYHHETNTMTVAKIRKDDVKKILVIGGDFYGIQNFIFTGSGETGSHRAKILRGRSFAVSLFSELAADMLCRRIGIPSVCVVFNAAGKFEIIAPNTESSRDAVCYVERYVNDWLMKTSYGETTMGIGCIEAYPTDFESGNYSDLRTRFADIMAEKKHRKIDLNRFGGTIEGYLDAFRNDLPSPICPFCGRRPSVSESSDVLDDKEFACDICRDHIFLGTNLVRKSRVAITSTDIEIRGAEKKLLRPIFDTYQVAFLDGGLSDQAAKGQVYKFFDISLRRENEPTSDITTRFLNGYVPVYTADDSKEDRYLHGKKTDRHYEELINQIQAGVPRTFEHIACMALNSKLDKEGFQGIAALGVLKADVDNLGKLMSCGLSSERITISRLSTLSRQLNAFFAVYLPDLLRSSSEFENVYTVFAGGDDLFLIGPWNRIIELSKVLNKSFARYVCHNPEVHFSAGITVHKPNTPVAHIAEQAEESLHAAKYQGKNRLTLFGETVEWAKMYELFEIRQQLEQWLQEGWINSAMLYRMNQLLEDAGMEKRVVKNQIIHIEDMDCTRWRAMLAYTIGRNVGRNLSSGQKNAEASSKMAKVIHVLMGKWLIDLGAAFKIPLWELLYNKR